jgi:hypothetical protein
VDGGARDRQSIPTIYHDFCGPLFRSNGALWPTKANAGSSTIFCDELDAGFFECARNCDYGILRHPDAAIGFRSLDGRNR